MMAGGYLTRSWNRNAVISYVLIWCFSFWLVLHPSKRAALLPMWIALNTGRPASAVFRLQQNGWYWFSILFNMRNLMRGLVFAGGFPSGSAEELFLVGLVSILTGVYFCATYFLRPGAVSQIRQLLLADMPDRTATGARPARPSIQEMERCAFANDDPGMLKAFRTARLSRRNCDRVSFKATAKPVRIGFAQARNSQSSPGLFQCRLVQDTNCSPPQRCTTAGRRVGRIGRSRRAISPHLRQRCRF